MKTLLILLSFLVSGCAQQTKEVSSGTYGPFSIGESKASALAKTERIAKLRSITPVPCRELYLESPSQAALHQLDGDEGILVWLGHNPWPLRIELENNKISGTWGASSPCRASQVKMNFACEEVKRLSTALAPGMSRQETYNTIVTFQTPLSKQAGNFVVGLKEFSSSSQTTEQEYRSFLLSKGGWKFDGLKELSRFNNPFYSTVTLSFEGDRLARVKHWSAPYELP